MAPGCGDASMASCLHRTGDDLSKVLAELQASGSIHFYKTLARRSNLKFSQGEKLCLPVWFVKEHGDKFEELVILRTLSSTKSWRVHLKVVRTPNGAPQARFRGGWSNFALDNRLAEGDSLVFVLNVDARSEFLVFICPRGITNSQTPAMKKLSEAEEVINRSVNEVINRSVNERQQILEDSSSQGLESEYAQPSKVVTPSQGRGFAPNSIPSFRRQLIPYKTKWAQNIMEVPSQFVKAHGTQLQDVVELQGVHQESPVRTVTCHRYELRGNTMRLFFKDGWAEFAKENGLKAGQELKFTLTSDSFFVVRVVV